jgi:hypothetical protein
MEETMEVCESGPVTWPEAFQHVGGGICFTIIVIAVASFIFGR